MNDKTKKEVNALRDKIIKRKEDEKFEEAEAKVNSDLTHEALDMFTDENGKHFTVLVRYNPETLEALVTKVEPSKSRLISLKFEGNKMSTRTLLKV